MTSGITVLSDVLEITELVLHVLGSAATKRDARSYLSRFRSEQPKKAHSKPSGARESDTGVNLGNLYLPVRAIDQSPRFVQGHNKRQSGHKESGALHTALVKIRHPQSIQESTLQQVALTLVQLSRLGMSSVVVVDCGSGSDNDESNSDMRGLAAEQADRVAAAIEHHDVQGARRLDSVLETSAVAEGLLSPVKVRSGIHITNRSLLLTPLRKGKIPVLAPIAFASNNQVLALIPADEAILALTRDFAGLSPQLVPEADPLAVANHFETTQKEVSLDRIILLDPLGGIPAPGKIHQAHVFVNLEQEYESIALELSRPWVDEAEAPPPSKDAAVRPFAFSNSTPKIWDADSSLGNSNQVSAENRIHLKNLGLLRDTLAILPPSSSGLLTTPETAANLERSQQPNPHHDLPAPLIAAPGVGTRRNRNPLIHNLLTDKPVYSSSLPSDRTQRTVGTAGQSHAIVPATFIKRGMPVTIIPDPRIGPWRPPTAASPAIQLSDPRIDLPRLIHLIEDSFGRKLDVRHYLSRISDRLAGIIVAGEYEGGALLTWESPTSKANDPQVERTTTMVPYLDKFAVLKRSQGAGGVADIVFTALVRTCFPDGVCWRSRKDNPVNKWYFERAKGTWKIPDSNWTMFWTTEGVQAGGENGVFGDYEAVCRGVEPSWADRTGVVD
ncbi:MAG: hypothetical protein LQ346_001713 [Caloplaca aetnensis]|nr:MAG: hypothetical protein LQ346_001713 [Caloplaca aetnensis]